MKRILVVDDDPLVSMSIRLTLEREGSETVSADGGETGLLALEDASFDAVIVDIFMPQMRGFDSVRVFRQCATRSADRDLRLRLRAIHLTGARLPDA